MIENDALLLSAVLQNISICSARKLFWGHWLGNAALIVFRLERLFNDAKCEGLFYKATSSSVTKWLVVSRRKSQRAQWFWVV